MAEERYQRDMRQAKEATGRLHKSIKKKNEQQTISKILFMGMQSLSPEQYDHLESGLKLICEARGLSYDLAMREAMKSVETTLVNIVGDAFDSNVSVEKMGDKLANI